MFKKPHLILGRDLEEQLEKTAYFLGSFPLLDFIKRYDLPINPKIDNMLRKYQFSDFVWESLIDPMNNHLFDKNGLDLMKKLMDMDADFRCTIDEALEHPFLSD